MGNYVVMYQVNINSTKPIVNKSFDSYESAMDFSKTLETKSTIYKCIAYVTPKYEVKEIK